MDNSFNPFSIAGNKYLITGAGSGIGKTTSVLLSRMNADLILIDIDEDGLESTKSLCKQTDVTLKLDLRESATLKKAVLETVVKFGKINGIIHLAGRPYVSPLKSISEEKCREIYSVNTYAAIELAKIFSNRDVYAGENGSVIFISSIYALVGSSANVGYAMSKAALHGITKSLAIELAPKKIRVNCIAPGFVDTKMGNEIESFFDDEHQKLLVKLHPLGLGKADDVAYSILFLLSNASRWITGSILSVDGGFTAQ